MKKFFIILGISALMFSCVKEELQVAGNGTQNNGEAALEIVAELADFDTKTTTYIYNGTSRTVWVEGDVISIKDEDTGTSYSYRAKSGGETSTKFEAVGTALPSKSTYNLTAKFSPDGLSVSQTTDADGLNHAGPLTATFSGAASAGTIGLQFSQDASLIDLQFKDASAGDDVPLELTELELTSINGEQIAPGATTITVTPSSASSRIQAIVSKVNLAQGNILLKATTADNTEYYKVIRQGVQTDLSGGKHATLKVNLNQKGISNKADLLSFKYLVEHELSLANYQDGHVTDGSSPKKEFPIIKLLADIDMGATSASPIEWEPIGVRGTTAKCFNGKLDGQGHSIYNFNVEFTGQYFGFFSQLSLNTNWANQINNLNLGSKNGAYDGVSKITFTGNSSGWSYCGALCSEVRITSGNIQITNCKNYIPIEITESSTKVRVGGFFGHTARVQFNDCENHGDITSNTTQGATNAAIGGFVGDCGEFYYNNEAQARTQSLRRCKNYGKITINGSSFHMIGGIVGRAFCEYGSAENPAQYIGYVDCENHGDIVVNACYKNARNWVGGLIGYIHDTYGSNKVAMPITRCKNYGKINFNGIDGNSVNAYQHEIGGLVGVTDGQLTFTDCYNEEGANITYSGDQNQTTTSKLGAVRIGGILGDNKGSGRLIIDNCHNKANIFADHINSIASNSPYAIGGIVGLTWGLTEANEIKNCTNIGTITSIASNNFVAGIVGWHTAGYIDNCTNEGEISLGFNGSQPRHVAVAGIAARVTYEDGEAGLKRIKDCTNKGNILMSAKTGAANFTATAGGIVGSIGDIPTNNGSTLGSTEIVCPITGCTNENEIWAVQNSGDRGCLAGGIVGFKSAKAVSTDSYNVNKGPVVALGYNSPNEASRSRAGGIVGKMEGGAIDNCSNYASVKAGLMTVTAKTYSKKNPTAIFSNLPIGNHNLGYAGSICGHLSGGTVSNSGVGGSVQDQNNTTEVTLTGSNYNSHVVSYPSNPTGISGSRYMSPLTTMNFLYWNIFNGMVSDQANNYSNFNSWVSAQGVDLCVWCEAAKLYDNDGNKLKKNNTWWGSITGAEGTRDIPSFSYGHSTVKVSNLNSYPQMVTAKSGYTFVEDHNYETNTTERNYRHEKIQIAEGKVINLVTLHLSFTTNSDGTAHTGLGELQEILGRTYLASSNRDNEYAGGIVGMLYNEAVFVSDCHNTGSVTAKGMSAGGADTVCAGGIVGYTCKSSVQNCTSDAQVTSTVVGAPALAGAASGKNKASISSCGVAGKVSGTVLTQDNFQNLLIGDALEGSNCSDCYFLVK